MKRWIQYLFFLVVIRPLVLIVIGLNIRHRERIPKQGPAILVANHNSHLDTLVLMTIMGSKLLPIVRPVAAADYFFSNAILKWFSLTIMNIIPLQRKVTSFHQDPLADISKAIEGGDIALIFPEGTRGVPEQMSEFKKGISHLAECHPKIPIIPIFLHGLGKSLPSGEPLFVPFFCDVFVGEELYWNGEKEHFMSSLQERMTQLSAEGHFPPWH